MGRGDNRRTPKARRKIAQRRLKARIQKRIAGGGATAAPAVKKVAPKKPVKAATVTRRPTE